MPKLNTDNLKRCINTLRSSLERLEKAQSNSIDHEVFRNAAVKGFELCLETSGKLLRKVLKSYTGNPKRVDELNYKDVFRESGKHGLLEEDAVKRWFIYRDNRNDTAHDYGLIFAQTTLKLLPSFLTDVENLEKTLAAKLKDMNAAS